MPGLGPSCRGPVSPVNANAAEGVELHGKLRIEEVVVSLAVVLTRGLAGMQLGLTPAGRL